MIDELVLVGCGRMGSALLSGWLARDMVARVFVVEPGAGTVPEDGRVTRIASAELLPGGLAPGIVVLAVKPQLMDRVAPAYGAYTAGGSLVLSIAAGVPRARLSRLLGGAERIVRAMPNTPASIGAGMSVLVAGAGVDEAARDASTQLMAAVGDVGWVEDEALMDAVTAVSGSGPAYVFHLVEALAAAGVAQGLPADLAMRLARSTVVGAGALAGRSEASADRLRRDVTSPGGTTEAALQVLMGQNGLTALMNRAVAAATQRSRELAK